MHCDVSLRFNNNNEECIINKIYPYKTKKNDLRYMNNFNIGVESIVWTMKVHFVFFPNVGFYHWCWSYLFVHYRMKTCITIQTDFISYVERFVKQPAVKELSLNFCQVVNLHIFELIRLWTCHKHINKN